MNVAGLRVVVSGGGIAGPAVALLLARAGADVLMLERVADYGEAGAGYVMQANGLSVLYGLGLEDALKPHGRIVTETTTVLEDGTPLAKHPMPRFAHGLDHGLAISRTILCGALRDALLAEPRIDARYGSEVVWATPDGNVNFRNADGDQEEITADLVIGADGVRSAVRNGGDFRAHLRDTGLAVVRLLADGEPGADAQVMSYYPTLESYGERWTRYGTTIAGRNASGRTYMSLATGAPTVSRAMQARDLTTLASLWGEVLPPAGRALSELESFDQLLVNQIEVVTCRRWTDGRLVLVGDAAHAMPPHLGQGASTALLDSAALALELVAALEDGGDVQQGLARYEARRRKPATKVQRMSWGMAVAADRVLEPRLRPLRDRVMQLAKALGRGVAPADLRARAVMQEDPGRVFESVRDMAAA